MLEVKCAEHLVAVREFARSINLESQLQKQLDFLSYYGWAGLPMDQMPPEAEQNICVLDKDFAPYSFTFALYRRDPKADNGRRFWFHGGLVFQGPSNPADGSFPSLTVSLATGTGWFVHT